MDERFETFTENEDEWFSDIELRALDLEKEISEWRESRARELADSARRERERELAEAEHFREEEYLRERERELAEPGFGRDADGLAHGHTAAFHRTHGTGGHRHREFLSAGGDHPGRSSASRTGPRPAAGRSWPVPDEDMRPAPDRTQVLIDRGRRTARRARSGRGRKIAIASAAGAVLLIIVGVIAFRKGPGWPASVAIVQGQI